MACESSDTLKVDAPAEEWANAPTKPQPVLQPQSYNFDEGPFAPDAYEQDTGGDYDAAQDKQDK